MKTPDKIYRVYLPLGDRSQTLHKLKVMWLLAKDGIENPEVLKTSREIVANIPSKNYRAEFEAVYDWACENLRYTQDPTGREMFHTPDIMLDWKQGDCDDHSILIASLLMCLNHPVRFKAVKEKGGDGTYAHVFPETKSGRQWVAMDSTMPEYDIGFIAPSAYSALRYP